MLNSIIVGNSLDKLKDLEDNSIDSIVTDPPYELGFMGKAWDSSGIAFSVELWAECLRVLKPGGYLLSFGGTRTWHRMAVGIEDAGFEIRDNLAWIYGTGFPKSLNISKAIDKMDANPNKEFEFTAWLRSTGLTAKMINNATNTVALGDHCMNAKYPSIPLPIYFNMMRPLFNNIVIPEWVEAYVSQRGVESENFKSRKVIGVTKNSLGYQEDGSRFIGDQNISEAFSPEAKQFEGWGTALKPAFEPIVMARKPLSEKTVAANVLKHGTGGINVDGSRIGGDVLPSIKRGLTVMDTFKGAEGNTTPERVGRFPSNLLLDETTASIVDEQSGQSKSTPTKDGIRGKMLLADERSDSAAGMYAAGSPKQGHNHNDSGGASRFFYVSKPGKNERVVLDGVAHPTVKPLTLMRYLIKMVTPVGGTVLDPFTGSGTTIEAAILEGFNYVGIELTEAYIPLIEYRIDRAVKSLEV